MNLFSKNSNISDMSKSSVLALIGTLLTAFALQTQSFPLNGGEIIMDSLLDPSVPIEMPSNISTIPPLNATNTSIITPEEPQPVADNGELPNDDDEEGGDDEEGSETEEDEQLEADKGYDGEPLFVKRFREGDEADLEVEGEPFYVKNPDGTVSAGQEEISTESTFEYDETLYEKPLYIKRNKHYAKQPVYLDDDEE